MYGRRPSEVERSLRPRAQVYKQLAGEDGVSLDRSPHNVRSFSIQNLAGDYRRLVQRPQATAWRLLRYSAPDAELATVPPAGDAPDPLVLRDVCNLAM
jgi:hypothetical protein